MQVLDRNTRCNHLSLYLMGIRISLFQVSFEATATLRVDSGTLILVIRIYIESFFVDFDIDTRLLRLHSLTWHCEFSSDLIKFQNVDCCVHPIFCHVLWCLLFCCQHQIIVCYYASRQWYNRRKSKEKCDQLCHKPFPPFAAHFFLSYLGNQTEFFCAEKCRLLAMMYRTNCNWPAIRNRFYWYYVSSSNVHFRAGYCLCPCLSGSDKFVAGVFSIHQS